MDDVWQHLGEGIAKYGNAVTLICISMLGWAVRVVHAYAEGEKLPLSVITANFISAACFSCLSGTSFIEILGFGQIPSILGAFIIGFSIHEILKYISKLGVPKMLRGKK